MENPSEHDNSESRSLSKIIKSWFKKKVKNTEATNEPVYGIIDVRKVLSSYQIEENIHLMEQGHEARRKNCGKIVINEEVPDNILNYLIKLTFIDSENENEKPGFEDAFGSYYRLWNRGYPDVRSVCVHCEPNGDFTSYPIMLLLDFITTDKRLHVRLKEVRRYVETFDAYLYTLKMIAYHQYDKVNHYSHYYSYHNENKLPITIEEIRELVRFHYSIMDKYKLHDYYYRENEDIDKYVEEVNKMRNKSF